MCTIWTFFWVILNTARKLDKDQVLGSGPKRSSLHGLAQVPCPVFRRLAGPFIAPYEILSLACNDCTSSEKSSME
jgi:hypothetical protein